MLLILKYHMVYGIIKTILFLNKDLTLLSVDTFFYKLHYSRLKDYIPVALKIQIIRSNLNHNVYI